RGAVRGATCDVRYVRLQHLARCTTHLAPHFALRTSHFALRNQLSVLLGRNLSLFNLLWSVFRLMPRISAARVLLSPVCASVIMIRRRSASSTVVPGPSATCGWCSGAGSAASDVGRCLISMNGPGERIVAR